MSRPTVEITRLSNGLTIATDHMPKLESAALGNSSLGAGMQVLTKPFAVEALTARVLDMIKDGAGPG